MLMTRDAFASFLERVAARVRSGDSAEGSVQYTLPEQPLCDRVEVVAAVRTGNLNGQGSMTLIEPSEGT